MLIYLDLISHANVQTEKFWYSLFTGMFGAATILYAAAKIFGPLLFGRGWCGYACWTAMIWDLLPYRVPQGPGKSIGFVRSITFGTSLIFAAVLFLFRVGNMERVIWSFLLGNVSYYLAGLS